MSSGLQRVSQSVSVRGLRGDEQPWVLEHTVLGGKWETQQDHKHSSGPSEGLHPPQRTYLPSPFGHIPAHSALSLIRLVLSTVPHT